MSNISGLLKYNLKHENFPFYGCPLLRSYLSVEVNGRTVRIFTIVKCKYIFHYKYDRQKIQGYNKNQK